MGTIFGCSHAEAKPECNALYSLGLVDRKSFEGVLYYTFRFGKQDYAAACLEVSNTRCNAPVSEAQWNSALELLESSGIVILQKAAGFIRDCVAEGITRFFTSDMRKYCSFSGSQCNMAMQTLVDRGLVCVPERKNMKHTIVVPSEVHHSDGELLQADVAHPDGEVLNDSIVDKLAEMRASERPVTQRIGNVLTEFLKKRLLRFTLADWGYRNRQV